MPSVDLSQQWDYPALPVGPVAVERPHGVIGIGSAVPAPFNLGAAPISTPSVTNFSPPPGTAVAPMTPLAFDALDTKGFRSVRIYATNPSGGSDLVFSGGVFVSPYSAQSSVAEVAGGLHFSILRDGGWQNQPQLTVTAINQDGIEA